MHPASRHMGLRHPTDGYIPTFLAHPGADLSKQLQAWKAWPSFPNNYGFPDSGYGCSGYGNYPVHHGSYLPYPCPAPSQFFCCGHQPYPGPFCAPYYPPPPYYPMELNPDGYRKEGGLSNEVRHCCGCPNHTHSEKSPRAVKVEELEPDTKRKQVDSFVPLQLKDNTYPIVLFPAECMNNRDEVQQPDQIRGGIEAPKNLDVPEQNRLFKQQQQPNGWFPLDMKRLASLFGDGEKKSLSDRDGDKEFQVPFVWMPSRQDKEHSYKGTDENSSHLVKKSDPAFKIFQPEHLRVKSSVDKSSEVKEDPSRSQGGSGEKEKHEKTIPVTEEKPCKDYDNSGNKVVCKRDGSSARAKDDVKSKITDAKRQSSSPPKTAKLSPVCLRVDPLPKKKNGSSRSPSPRGSKEKTMDTSQDSCKATAVTDVKVMDQENSCGLVDTRTKEENGKTNGDGNTDTLPQPASESNIRQGRDIAIMSESREFRRQGDLRNESTAVTKEPTDSVMLANGGQTIGVKRLSKEEAAKLIQSVYRGYYARKWEPLKKLRQIAGVREQLTGVRNGIHALEASTNCDEKQKVAMGEMIMNLLLKLDSIQGLHPNFRDIRKSLAKELVALHEHLDSLEIKKQEVSTPVDGNYTGNCASENSGKNPFSSVEVDSCDASTPSSVIKEAVTSEFVGSSSRYTPDLMLSDGDLLSKVHERTEDDVLTNIGMDQPEEVGAAVAQVPEGKPDVVGVAMQIEDSTHDDVRKGSTLEVEAYIPGDEEQPTHDDVRKGSTLEVEAYIPGDEEQPSEEKWNLACEGVKETDHLHKTSMGLGATGEERCVKPEEQLNEGFGDEVPEKKAKADVPAGEVTEDEADLCDPQDVKQERHAGVSLVVQGDAGGLALQKEPWTMEKEVAESAAEEPSVGINGGGIQGVLNGDESFLPKDQSSQSEAAVDSQPWQEEYEKPNQGEEQTETLGDEIIEGDMVSSSQPEAETILPVPEKKEGRVEEDIAGATEVDRDREIDGDEKSGIATVGSGAVQKVESVGNEDDYVVAEKDMRMEDENGRRMKEMMEKLVEAGNAQMKVISKLSSRVEDLEKKLWNNKSSRRTRRKCRSAKKKDASPAA
ncbi:BAG family molecular chaperone regulator 6 [Linum grandiflorum]